MGGGGRKIQSGATGEQKSGDMRGKMMSEDARRERKGRLAGMLHSWYCSRIQEEIEIFLDTFTAHM